MSSWTKEEHQLKFVANRNHEPDQLMTTSTNFGYNTKLTYMETTEPGVKNPNTKYSAVGIDMGESSGKFDVCFI